MDNEEARELLTDADRAEESEKPRAVLMQRWETCKQWIGANSFRVGMAVHSLRRLRRIYVAIVISFVALSVFIHQRSSTDAVWSNLQHSFKVATSPKPPFSGAFAKFPRKSELPERQRKMTVVSVWNDDVVYGQLRHFLYTMQLNAEYLDLVMINRMRTPESQCVDFDKAGINITWGGNIQVHCMDDKEWKRRFVDFLCSPKLGWNCNATEFEDVTKEFATREDKRNFNWRPLLGYVFRDLFPTPSNPFWAWMDFDIFIGNFAHYPFNILSQLSILTGAAAVAEEMEMAGQLTAFNMDDEALGTAWKKFPEMKTPTHFAKYIGGKMPESSEEGYWSFGYMSQGEDSPGDDLSYAIYPDLHGDDFFDNGWVKKSQYNNQTYIVSGKDILLVSTLYSREQIEHIIQMERSASVDDLGGIGWSGGEDGSSHLVEVPTLSGAEAKLLAINEVGALQSSPAVYDGFLEDEIMTNCTAGRARHKLCLEAHPLAVSNPPILRSSLIHFKEQQAGHILRRLERDQRPRGYERKLLRHHLFSKRRGWFAFPPFEITEDLVLRYNMDSVEVFKMGDTRGETLFYRKQREKNIG